jgi:hypothetical protein
VSELSIDSLVPSIFLQLVANPNSGEIECDVTFFETNNISVKYHGSSKETKSNYLCSLLGIDDTEDTNGVKYTITTDTTEVTFCTTLEPKIEWHDPNKPFQKWDREVINVKK